MAFTKAQLEALKNSLLASNQPITASIHRSFAQKLIDELYDAQSRGDNLAGVQASGSTVEGDQVLVIRSGVAYLIPASLFGNGITLDDINGFVTVDPQDGNLLAYNSLTEAWENIPNIYVPYSGATVSLDLGEFGLNTGFIKFDTTPTGTPTDQGTMSWDVDNETIDVVLNGFTMKIGEDLFYPVKNQTGALIPKGTAVRFNGTLGASGRLLIAPFLADGSSLSSRFMGVAAEDIADGENGKVLWFGRLRGLDTDAYNEGDILYASATVAGGYQTTAPTLPQNIISVAAVINKSATQGVLFVRPQIEVGFNPRVFVFNMVTNGTPDVSAGGAVPVKYASTNFTSIAVGDVAKMVIKGKIQTRNAVNLIASIGGSIGSGATFGLSTLGWNWSNANVGDFTFEITNIRTATGWRHKIDLWVQIFDGTVTEIKHLENTSTNAFGNSGGLINGSFTVSFAEASVENELTLISGILEVYKPTQP
jgi:hypothetical protein